MNEVGWIKNGVASKLKPYPAGARQKMETELRSWGVGLLVVGVVSILWSSFLNPVWGVLLIILGVFSFLVRKCGMFIVIGCGLLLAGFMNIMVGFGSGWFVFGCLQIYWAVQEFKKYSHFAKMLREESATAAVYGGGKTEKKPNSDHRYSI